MPNRRYADYAVEQLAQYLEETLPTFVTEVNTDQSDVTDPPVNLEQITTFARGMHPFSVELLPRVELEFQGMEPAEPAGFKNDIWDVEIGVHLVVGYEDADVVEGQRDLQRYVTALVRAIQDDIELVTADLNRVIECEILTTESSGAVSDIGRLYGIATVLCRVQIHEV